MPRYLSSTTSRQFRSENSSQAADIKQRESTTKRTLPCWRRFRCMSFVVWGVETRCHAISAAPPRVNFAQKTLPRLSISSNESQSLKELYRVGGDSGAGDSDACPLLFLFCCCSCCCLLSCCHFLCCHSGACPLLLTDHILRSRYARSAETG
jgi:hypothetical protein